MQVPNISQKTFTLHYIRCYHITDFTSDRSRYKEYEVNERSGVRRIVERKIMKRQKRKNKKLKKKKKERKRAAI